MVLWQKGQFCFLCLIMKATVTHGVFYAQFHHGKYFFCHNLLVKSRA